ncbi:MAG: tRNA dihydrouridine(20/20a) synthase DusA [Psittacicella sp.]
MQKPLNPKSNLIDKISVAPMLDITTSHCRYFHRLYSKNTTLYTEMVTTSAILNSKYDILKFNKEENPLILQIAGSNPKDSKACAKIINSLGYNGINLNLGCPSFKVQNAMIGAVLMKHKELVKENILAIEEVSDLPISIKVRTGVDDLTGYQFIHDFIDYIVNNTNTNTYIIHARDAILNLDPKSNRSIPELDYKKVYKLKEDFPNKKIILNGGVSSNQEIITHLEKLDGVMLGRAIDKHPSLLGTFDKDFFNAENYIDSVEAVLKYMPYMEKHLVQNTSRPSGLLKPLLNAFNSTIYSKKWRRFLSEEIMHNKSLKILEYRSNIENFIRKNILG